MIEHLVPVYLLMRSLSAQALSQTPDFHIGRFKSTVLYPGFQILKSRPSNSSSRFRSSWKYA
jgi:hypothetical protein